MITWLTRRLRGCSCQCTSCKNGSCSMCLNGPAH